MNTPIPKFDAHQHLILPETFDYPWTAGFDILQQRHALEDYLEAAAGTGISQSLFVEVDVPASQSADEAAWFCQRAEAPDSSIAGVIASGRPELDHFEDHLARIDHPRLKGIRRVLHTGVDDALMAEPTFRRNLRLLGERQLSFDICARQDQLTAVDPMVAACPDTTFILDHLGNPRLDSEAFGEWKERIERLARHENLHCKISGMIAGAPEQLRSADGLRPWVESAIESFGWDRVLFGGDWPVCLLGSTLANWTDILEEILKGHSDRKLEALFMTNAQRIYRIDS